MAKVRITVVHPTERVDNSAIALASWQLFTRPAAVTDGGWQPVGPANTIADGDVDGTRDVDNVPNGDWSFGATWRDTDGQDSDLVQTDITVGGVVLPARPKAGSISAEIVG